LGCGRIRHRRATQQRSFTNGRIIVACGKVRRGKQRRADYLLYYRRDFPLAVVEAKELGLPATLERVFAATSATPT
jgi:type I site-specific restriction endonuclease